LTTFNPNLTPAQVGERLGVSTKTLAHWRCAGVGPTYLKPGGSRVVYREADVLAYEEACLIRTVSA
jgi:predicted site-specific integrase-resolvase